MLFQYVTNEQMHSYVCIAITSNRVLYVVDPFNTPLKIGT